LFHSNSANVVKLCGVFQDCTKYVSEALSVETQAVLFHFKYSSYKDR